MVSNAQSFRLAKGYQCGYHDKANRARKSNFCSGSADPTPIQPIPSASKTTMLTTTATVTLPARTTSTTTPVQTIAQQVETAPLQTYSTHYPNLPYQQHRPSKKATTTQSTTQHATSTSYTLTTILQTYSAYTSTRYTPSTTRAPPNPLSNLNNYGYAYGRLGFGAGATGMAAYSTTKAVFRIRTRRTPRQPLHLRRLHATELLAQPRPCPALLRMQVQIQ